MPVHYILLGAAVEVGAVGLVLLAELVLEESGFGFTGLHAIRKEVEMFLVALMDSQSVKVSDDEHFERLSKNHGRQGSWPTRVNQRGRFRGSPRCSTESRPPTFPDGWSGGCP